MSEPQSLGVQRYHFFQNNTILADTSITQKMQRTGRQALSASLCGTTNDGKLDQK